ncbi:MAG: DUF885 domain-containing protein [Pseudomonadota bacterium]|jgi:uncharacterized protein (DUF885 family)|nr:MAG: DUF885 domain-containing protein [Pseudomonadota bacterium]
MRASPILALLLLAACTTTPPDARPGMTESDRLNAWLDAQYEEELRFSPMQLTFLGRKELNDQLDDVSVEAMDRQLAWQRRSVREMQRRFDYGKLDDEAKLSYELWKYRYEMAAAMRPWLLHMYMFDQMNGMQSQLPTFMINFHAVDTEADFEAYLSRLAQFPRLMRQLIEQATASAKLGIRPPRFAHEAVIDQARKVISGAPFDEGPDSALWADLKAEIEGLVTSGAITPSRIPALQSAARNALLAHVKPAYEELIAWIGKDLPEAPVNASGVGSRHPDGLAFYAAALRNMTTLPLSPQEVHRTGLAEVARIRAEMEQLKEKTGFTGSLAEFFRFLHTDPRFRFPNTDEGRQAYLDAATAAIDNIRRQLPQFFGLLPKADLVVRRVEPFREQAGAAQHYYPPAPDGSRPGIYYAHLIDMQALPIPELEVTAYHEGIPGHHMQMAIAQQLTGLPQFRRQASFNAYTEGWALYAEALAREMPGTYQDPYSDFGRLTMELFRAVRLVVDTGLHAMGWTEQQAVDYFVGNTPLSEAAVRSEVRRYLIWPGQATGYKLGMMKIQELRRRAETELGGRFDLRAFHDAVLGGGALPLPLLERRIDDWIASRRR